VKVGLVHTGDVTSRPDLIARLRRHGHDVATAVHPAGVARLPLARLDAIVVAGGDGTVATVLAGLRNPRLPVAVLPMGTANNIAACLGWFASAGLDGTIAAWSGASICPFDVGVATGPWGERRFVESVGGGLVTHGIVVMDRRDDASPTAEARLARARQAYRDVVLVQPASSWGLSIDGRAVDGRFVAVEVLNIDRVGPGLVLAAASPSDGRFTVVAVPVDARARIADWLAGDTAAAPAGLTLGHGSEVVLHAGDRLHVDDAVVEWDAVTPVRLHVDAGAVAVLTPTGRA